MTYSRRPVEEGDEEAAESYRQERKKEELESKTADELNDFRRKVSANCRLSFSEVS